MRHQQLTEDGTYAAGPRSILQILDRVVPQEHSIEFVHAYALSRAVLHAIDERRQRVVVPGYAGAGVRPDLAVGLADPQVAQADVPNLVAHQGRSFREPGGRVLVDLGLHLIDQERNPHAATSIPSRSAALMP